MAMNDSKNCSVENAYTDGAYRYPTSVDINLAPYCPLSITESSTQKGAGIRHEAELF